MKICDGVPMLLSILHYDNLKLIWNVVGSTGLPRIYPAGILKRDDLLERGWEQ